MSKLFQNGRFLLAACILAILAAGVPAAISVSQLVGLRSGIEKIGQVSSVSTQAHNVLNIVGNILPSFTATALNLSAEERSEILSETDQQFRKLEKAVEDLRAAASTVITEEQDATLTDAIASISHSWEEIRGQSSDAPVDAEITYHFLSILAEVRAARQVLESIHIQSDTAAETATASSFERIKNANLLLIFVLSASALIGLIAVSGNFHFTRSMQRSNERFNAALSNMSAALCMFDGERRLIVGNERYASMYGLPPELLKPGTLFDEIIRHRIANRIYSGSTAEEYTRERLSAVMERDPSTKIQELSDGRFVAISHCPMSGGGWLATHEDVTEQKRAERALQESEKQFRNLVEGSIQGVFIHRDWKLLFANSALAGIFGYVSPEDLLSLGNIRPLLAPDEHDRLWGYKTARQKGEPVPDVYEVKGVRKDGSTIWAEFRSILIDWQGAMAMQCVVIDITDRKKAESELIRHRDHLQELVDTATMELKANAEELKEALAKEQELNELQRQFVSMASHEFRTPLAIIDGVAQRMKRRAGKNQLTPEDAVQRVEKIRSAVRRMTRLMESTLTAARMQEGKIKVEIGPCDITKVVNDVCARQREVAGSHTISCHFTDIPETIQADTGSLEQVLTNLLANAVKYSPDAPDIDVTVRREGHHVVISVSDHGIGIDEDDLRRIGERFFRAKTSTGIAGTGIGLNLVKTLVEEHGGTLGVESAKGDGSIFTIRLPIAGPDRCERAASRVA